MYYHSVSDFDFFDIGATYNFPSYFHTPAFWLHDKNKIQPGLSFLFPYSSSTILTATDKPVTIITVLYAVHHVLKVKMIQMFITSYQRTINLYV